MSTSMDHVDPSDAAAFALAAQGPPAGPRRPAATATVRITSPIDVEVGWPLARPVVSDAEALRRCAQITARSGSNFYLAFLPMPRERRDGIFAVYAFCRIVDDAVDEPEPGTDPREEVAKWRERVRAIARKQALPDAHPVAVGLAATHRRFGLREEDLTAVLDGVEMDLGGRSYRTWDELSLYCERVAGRVGCLCLPVFGASDRTRDFALALGAAFQLTNILRDVGRDAQAGRIYLPTDDLERHGVDPDDILAGRSTPELRALVRESCGRAETLFDQADRLLDPAERPVLYPALIMAAIYRRVLDALTARDVDPLAGRVSLPAHVKAILSLGVFARDRLLQLY